MIEIAKPGDDEFTRLAVEFGVQASELLPVDTVRE